MKGGKIKLILDVRVTRLNGYGRLEGSNHVSCCFSLRLMDVLWAEQELAIEVRHVNRVQIDDLHMEYARG